MKNILFNTSVRPYRIDLYNALYDESNFELYFLRDKESDNAISLNIGAMYELCHFEPHILRGVELGRPSRKFCFGLFRLLRDNEPECVIVNEFQVQALQVLFLCLFLKKRPKLLSICDDSYDMIVNGNDFTLVHRMARRICTRLLDDIIVVEPRVCEWYRQHYNKGIWMPIISDEVKGEARYADLLPLSNVLNHKYGLEGKHVVLFVGRLVDVKNVHTIIEAVSRTTSDCVLVIVGDGPERANLERQAKNCSHQIIFTGQLQGDDLYAWYNIADIFVLASYREPFGAVVNEALLAGCYTIVSNCVGAACLINENNGEIIPPFDVDAWCKAIDKRLSMVGAKPTQIGGRHHMMNVMFRERLEHLKQYLIKR